MTIKSAVPSTQSGEDEVRHPIGFWSRGLTPAERNYSVVEKECLAVVWAVQILRPYLERSHFDLFTDHQALKWIMNLSDASGRLARWRLRLLEYDFTVQYGKGAKNQIADAVSRLPTIGETPEGPDLDVPCFVVESTDRVSVLPDYAEASNSAPPREVWEVEPEDESHRDDDATIAVAEPHQDEEETALITVEELLREQRTDPYCKEVRDLLRAKPDAPFM